MKNKILTPFSHKIKPRTCVNCITEWSNLSRETINFTKSKIMHFGSKVKKEKQAFIVDEYTIECVHTYRYLGFLLDQELTFKADLKQTMRTISQKFYMFKNLDVAKAISFMESVMMKIGVTCKNSKTVYLEPPWRLIIQGTSPL